MLQQNQHRSCVAYLSTYPEGARRKSQHAAAEPRLLAFGSYTFVDAFPQPDVRVDVP